VISLFLIQLASPFSFAQNDEGPTVSLLRPQAGATVSGQTEVVVSATGRSRIAWVLFYVDNSFRALVNAPPFTYLWNTIDAANGPHTIQARAIDADKRETLTPALRVLVNNVGGWTMSGSELPAPTAAAVPATPAAPATVAAPAVPAATASPSLSAPTAARASEGTIAPTVADARPTGTVVARAYGPRDASPTAEMAAPVVEPVVPKAPVTVAAPVAPVVPVAPARMARADTQASPARSTMSSTATSRPTIRTESRMALPGAALAPTAPVARVAPPKPVRVAAPAPVAPVAPVALVTPARMARADTRVAPARSTMATTSTSRPTMSAGSRVALPGAGMTQAAPVARVVAPVAPAKPQQVAMLPRAAAAAVATVFRGSDARHTVQPGETLYGIARTYGVRVDRIAAANSLADPSRLVAGTELRIPSPTAFITMDGQPVFADVRPSQRAGIAVMPLRQLIESRGGSISWLPASREIQAKADGQSIAVKVGSREAKVNERSVLLDIAAFLERGRTIVPVSFICDALHLTADVDAKAGRVAIASEK
jgi:LysM repeat protein